MEKMAVPTGDVIKEWDIREGENLFFIALGKKGGQFYKKTRILLTSK